MDQPNNIQSEIRMSSKAQKEENADIPKHGDVRCKSLEKVLVATEDWLLMPAS